MTKVKMPAEFGEIYPHDVDTVGDAPASYVTMFADFFEIRNLRLPLTIFMVELLEYYNIHISQLSPLGMVHARHFKYCFRSQNIEPLVEDFQRFYQMTVLLGFFSFIQRNGAPKIMTAPKGLTKWKAKFFYIKEVAVTCKLHFRNVTGPIAKEQLNVPELGQQEWVGQLQAVPLKSLGNKELQYCR
ncbi:hypothetical protein HanRHA438_Chr03g0112001 [Helianthus annuus]|uniref:Transposase (putative) gypsy type domain-containing protein n=1 Tax=Helianthus annuus TaxID=4232 RepID=A0A9K3JFK2_HELAN|nr:hypothetical protein HanXRQr2_Chr03g0100821 [Helianthus annuus]KAJ0592352.1 hypothetical protein HanHA300_Chr03g0084051 [Helianthus annuus]KAJ0599884.1 hypothetical protein HanIR_Chr03g0110191 [Helianthus annuus]KAJ0607339.1 hypothetical protein HanHA89_Chr03g0095561 [Helianthus annuus]KAJ0767395.1 hypothetical protein HanLR1_Chr03g0088831 [Helianthus annuus]